MKNTTSFILLLSLILLQCDNAAKITMPDPFPEEPVTDDYFGQNLTDPYRHMEDLEDSTVLSWYQKQTEYTNTLLNNINGKKDLLDQVSEASRSYGDVASSPKIIENGMLFYLKRSQNENVSRLFFRDNAQGTEKVVFDPKQFDEGSGNEYLINYFEPSNDGSKVVISFTKNDEEISQMMIVDVASGSPYPQIIGNCWPSTLAGISWFPDDMGFTYTHIPDIDANSESYLLNTAAVAYTIGQDPQRLNTVLSKEHNPSLSILSREFPIVVSKDSKKYVFGRIGGARNYDDYYYAEYTADLKNVQWKTLYKTTDEVRTFLVDGDDIIFMSAKDVTNFQICKTSLTNPDFKNPTVLVREDDTAPITDFAITNNGLFYVKTKNGVAAHLYRLNDDGEEVNVLIPKESGHISLTSNSSVLWIEIEGWTNDLERYTFNFETDEFELLDLENSASEFKTLTDVVVKEIEITSHDGAKVPLSIIHKKDLKLDGTHRLLMTGYGAYGISDAPYLDRHLYHWVSMGGVYAIAHVRGGGEKGDSWYRAGYKSTKANTWKDFIACTEYLIDQKYAASDKIAAWSASAGGILIGRAITERPDLYRAAIIKSGILNAVRAENGPNGPNNIAEFGTVADSTDFNFLLKMDAFHHVKPGVKYPAVLLTTGINDARVPAWSSGKFASKLMTHSARDNSVFLNVDIEGGHGYNSTLEKDNLEIAEVLAFSLWQTGHPDFQLKD